MSALDDALDRRWREGEAEMGQATLDRIATALESIAANLEAIAQGAAGPPYRVTLGEPGAPVTQTWGVPAPPPAVAAVTGADPVALHAWDHQEAGVLTASGERLHAVGRRERTDLAGGGIRITVLTACGEQVSWQATGVAMLAGADSRQPFHQRAYCGRCMVLVPPEHMKAWERALQRAEWSELSDPAGTQSL